MDQVDLAISFSDLSPLEAFSDHKEIFCFEEKVSNAVFTTFSQVPIQTCGGHVNLRGRVNHDRTAYIEGEIGATW